MAGDKDHFILICTTCKGPRAAGRLRGALAQTLPARYAIRAVPWPKRFLRATRYARWIAWQAASAL
ncbi:MAG: hypothetical protein GJ676_12670 [Rhodobacteraceae bacterium]|nr:hypothetical protein [Paracoccaceae bacterium]